MSNRSNLVDDQVYVISLGGSLVSPTEGPDANFLAMFRSIISEELNKGKRFYIIVGGGHPARQYQAALAKLGATDKNLDHIGIFATHLNAYYVALAFNFPPEHKVVLKVEKLTGEADLHITGAGLEPGQSSDTVAVQTAVRIGAKTVINFSNIDQVYSADPDADSSATPFDTLSWLDYQNIIPDTWQPGLSTPFDPVASRLAAQNEVDVMVLGSDIANFKNYIEGQPCLGTLISNKYDSTKN